MAKAMSHSKWQMDGRFFPAIFPWYLSLFVVQTPSRSVSFIEPSPKALWCNGENPASVGIIKACQLAVIHQLTISIGAALCLSTIFCRSRMASSPTPGLCLLLQLGTNDWKHEHVIKNTAWWLSSVICSCHSPWDYHGVLNTFLQGWRPWKGPGLRGICEKKTLQWAWGHGDRWWISISWWIRSQTPSPPSCGAWVCQSHPGDAWNGGDAAMLQGATRKSWVSVLTKRSEWNRQADFESTESMMFARLGPFLHYPALPCQVKKLQKSGQLDPNVDDPCGARLLQPLLPFGPRLGTWNTTTRWCDCQHDCLIKLISIDSSGLLASCPLK